jgi:hypothetical protein
MEHFRITYDGTALENHEMDVRALAPALLAVGDLLENANRVLNGDNAKVSINVRGSMKTGSVAIDFSSAQTILSQIVDLFSSKEVTAAATILALLGMSAKDLGVGMIQVIKWLRGRKITSIRTVGQKAIISVDDEALETEAKVIDLLRDYQLRLALEAMLEPLEKEGIDTLAIGSDTMFREVITSSQRPWFIAPPPAAQELDQITYEKTLQIERIEFNKENKWRFTDGSSSFYAVITDPAFLDKIATGSAAFSASDTLKVRIVEHQRLEEGKLKSSYQISQVFDHQKTVAQIALDF